MRKINDEQGETDQSVCGPTCDCRSKAIEDSSGTEATKVKRLVYLDHSATTPVRPEVVEAMLPYLSGDFGNASSVHQFGQKARTALEEAREVVADCIGAESNEIIFTGGGTESDNLAVQGVVHGARKKGNHVITSSVEHHAVYKCCKYLEKEGVEVTYLPVDEFGIVDLDSLRSSVRSDTVLVSVMLANNETGTIEPLSDVSAIAHEHGVPVHTDAVQAIGKIPVNVDDLGIALLSLSGHKIYGPKGVGVLYVRRGTRVDPMFYGGHHERRKRPGTENVASIIGLAKAMELARAEINETSTRLAGLRDRLQDGILRRIDHVRLNGHPEKRLPNVLNVSIKYVEGESLLLSLDMAGIAVSTGSACTSGSLEPSHVLLAMGIDVTVAHGSLRFSFGRCNVDEDVDYVVDSLVEVVQRLRSMSPFNEGK